VPDEPVVSAGDEPAIEVTEGARVGREAGAVPCARPAMERAEQAGVHPGGEVPAAVQRPELGEEPPGDAMVAREAGEVPGPEERIDPGEEPVRIVVHQQLVEAGLQAGAAYRDEHVEGLPVRAPEGIETRGLGRDGAEAPLGRLEREGT